MSLIHDALRQSTTTTDGSPSPVIAASWLPQLAGYRRPAAWLAAGMLVAAPATFLLVRTHAANHVAPANVITMMPTTAVMPVPATTDAIDVPQKPAALPLPATVITAAHEPALKPAPMPSEAMPPPMNIAITASAPAPAPITDAATPRTGASSSASQIQLSVRKLDTAGSKAASNDETNAVAVRMAMSALNAAVAEHDAGGSADAIAQLQALLPAQSLTLLRAQAWAAHGGGDYNEAERLYRTILERVPDDEHAGINLALLQARRGEFDDARQRLAQLSGRYPRSPQVARALAELDDTQQ